jgi:DNA polymerase-3 subunit delta
MSKENQPTAQELYNAIVNEVKSKQFKSVYFLQGDELFYLDKVVDFFLNNVIDESARDFDMQYLYTADVDAQQLMGYLNQYPLMSDYQLVIYKENNKVKNWDWISTFLKNPSPKTILVIAARVSGVDGKTSLAKKLKSEGMLFNFKKLYDNQIPGWILSYVKSLGLKINDTNARLLAEHLGNDLSKIAGEIDKLKIHLTIPGSEITNQHIEDYIGISKEFNTLELGGVILEKNWPKALRMAEYFSNTKETHPIAIIGSLFGIFQNLLLIHYHLSKGKNRNAIYEEMHLNFYQKNDFSAGLANYPYKKTVENIALLKKYDLFFKGLGASNRMEVNFLKELFFQLMH